MSTAARALLLFSAILSAILTLVIALAYTLPSLTSEAHFHWEKILLFPGGVCAFGLGSLIAWLRARKQGLKAALVPAILAALSGAVLITCVPLRTGIFSAAPCNMPAFRALSPSDENAVLQWYGIHLGFPVDFLHLYIEIPRSGLYLGFAPHWLLLDWSVVYTLLYIALLAFRRPKVS